MSISIVKLEQLFKKNDITPLTYYTHRSQCILITCIQKCQMIVIQLDPEWQFTIPKKIINQQILTEVLLDPSEGSESKSRGLLNSFMKEFESPLNHIDNLNDVIKKYDAGSASVKTNRQPFEYSEFDEADITNTLSNQYSYNITLDNLLDADIKELKDISRQLERVALCVKQKKYALCIMYNHYIVITHPRGNHCAYKSNDLAFSPMRVFHVVCTLERLFENISQVSHDIVRIKTAVDEILHINMSKHLDKVRGMVRLHDGIVKNAFTVGKLKANLIRKYQSLLHSINYKNMGTERSEIESSTISCGNTLNNLTLSTDKILFDNVVMYNAIIKNWEILNTILDGINRNPEYF